jgi:Zn-dependent membrane protease YugP
MMTYLLIFGVFMLASWLVSHQLKSRFKKYLLLPMNNGYTGRDVAEKMLRENGIIDVKIISVLVFLLI